MKFVNDASGVPEPKKKQIISKLERHEEYLKLRQLILSARMRPMQEAGIFFGPEDAKRLNYTNPARAASDGLKRLIKSSGLSADYTVERYMTDTPEIWFVKVRYEPPMSNTVREEQPRMKKSRKGAA